MDSTFKVYEGNEILDVGKPFVIITGKREEGEIISELFIFDENGNQELIWKKYKINEEEIINAETKTDISFVMRYASDTINGELKKWRTKEREGARELSCFYQSFTFNEIEPIRLYRLFKKKENRESLDIIYEKTRSKKLKAFFTEMHKAPEIKVFNNL
jgi:hypothetical protein